MSGPESANSGCGFHRLPTPSIQNHTLHTLDHGLASCVPPSLKGPTIYRTRILMPALPPVSLPDVQLHLLQPSGGFRTPSLLTGTSCSLEGSLPVIPYLPHSQRKDANQVAFCFISLEDFLQPQTSQGILRTLMNGTQILSFNHTT